MGNDIQGGPKKRGERTQAKGPKKTWACWPLIFARLAYLSFQPLCYDFPEGGEMESFMKTFISMVLSFFSAFSPTAVNKENVAVPAPAVVAAQPTAEATPIRKTLPAPPVARIPDDTMVLLTPYQPYRYTFTGTAVCNGQPCANARLLVRVISAHVEEIRQTETGADGSYAVEVSLVGSPQEPVDWEINAQAPDAKKARFEGRQIMMDDPSVTIERPVEFIES